MRTNTLILKLFKYLSNRRRVQIVLAFLIMILGAVAEAISLAAVMPFLWALMNPKEVLQWPIVKTLSHHFGIFQPEDFLWIATIIFGTSILVAGIVRLLNVWFLANLPAAIGSDLSKQAFLVTLYQPYSIHLESNSSSLISSMTTQLDLTVLAINQFLLMVSSSIILVALIITLLVVDWQLALFASGIALFIYGIIVGLVRSAVLQNSEKIVKGTVLRIKILQESLGAIRDVILDGSQKYFLDFYASVDRPMRKKQAQNQFFSLYPRFAIETLGMIMIVSLAYGLLSQRGNPTEVIPILGMLALAAQRLLPNIQQVYSAWADIRSKSYAILAVLEVVDQVQPAAPQGGIVPEFVMRQHICFENVTYGYASGPLVLHNLNFRICKGRRIGIIGTTGSGKSALLDLLMGLLSPTAGKIRVDGIKLEPSNQRSWQSQIAHVPQNIYLADSTIAENIAFGVAPHGIDLDRVKEVSKLAQIAQVIEALSSGYNTYVGERGVRLSGGQRQRIGIARALYKKSDMLVLDEATSALDTDTERAVMQAIYSLSPDLTILIVAHRLTTLEKCDQIIELHGGHIKQIGTYQEIVRSSA